MSWVIVGTVCYNLERFVRVMVEGSGTTWQVYGCLSVPASVDTVAQHFLLGTFPSQTAAVTWAQAATKAQPV